MLIDGLGRTIQADREREIKERLRVRGLLRDAGDTSDRKAAATAGQGGGSSEVRPAAVRSSGIPAHGRTR